MQAINMSALESLKQFTTVVADTGDFEGKYGRFQRSFLFIRSYCQV